MSTGRENDGVAGRRVVLVGLLGASAGVAVAAAREAPRAATGEKPIGDEGVGPGEDLMREHGVLNRILLVYDEAVRRIREKEVLPADTIRASAEIITRFLEGYHEKLEEEHLFPRFEKAGRLVELVTVLRAQHGAGRRETAAILAATAGSGAVVDAAAATLSGHLGRFTRMYRPHEAREDTVLFPAFRELVTKDEYQRLGDAFESRETQVLGERGFERIVDEVAQIERRLGIAELSSFTPAP